MGIEAVADRGSFASVHSTRHFRHQFQSRAAYVCASGEARGPSCSAASVYEKTSV